MTEKSDGGWRAGLYREKENGAWGVGSKLRHITPRSPGVAQWAFSPPRFHVQLDGARANNQSDLLRGRAVQAGQSPNKHFEISEGAECR
jgi:hypothetical protein